MGTCHDVTETKTSQKAPNRQMLADTTLLVERVIFSFNLLGHNFFAGYTALLILAQCIYDMFWED